MNTVFKVYLATGLLTCLWYSVATYKGWRMGDFVPAASSSSTSSSRSWYSRSYSGSGRSSGGTWGGGK